MSSRKLSDTLTKSREKSQKKMMSFMADQVARVVPNIISELQGSNTSPSSVDSKTEKSTSAKFNYKHFVSCNPKPFTGSDGVTAMLEWFDNIEVTFINSECPEHLKTRSATGMFQGRALEWWTNERNIRTNEEAYALPWAEVRELMMLEFCSPHEQLKLEEEFWYLKQVGDDSLAYTTRFKQLSLIVPHLVSTPKRMITKYINGLPPAMRDSIEFPTPATSKSANQATQQPSDSKNKKRKSQGSGCNVIVPAANPAAKPAPTPAAANPAAPEAKKQYTGSYPKCTTCNFHHPTASACRLCTNCNRYGHTTPYCCQANQAQQAQQAPAQAALPAPLAPLQNPKPVNAVRACFQCGDTTHLRNRCPQLNQEQQAAAHGRAFNLNANQARNNNDVVNGRFLVNNLYASILFDTGADKSFVSVEFESLINCTRSKLPESFSVVVANGKSILVNSIVRDCPLTLNDHVFSIDLIPMQLGSFVVIIGMDWLRKNHAEIVCHDKLVHPPLPSGDTLNVYGDRPSKGLSDLHVCIREAQYSSANEGSLSVEVLGANVNQLETKSDSTI
ncbi:uncharacterized protein LOC110906856 [Helianthus annuus]|uniref:uncharacterized protein LOC110906856 n=1 Tax=Helianthus annuus TaxID=4232 RepID=UPI000B8EF923|nr:uncharacterized protein LOC110906856 [Helianthus annuus]